MYTGVESWITNTAFPALTKCFEFFVNVITDLVDNFIFSRLGFFLAIFLIGTAITTIVAIFINAPDISADGSYSQFGLIKPKDLFSRLSLGVHYTGYKFFYRMYKYYNSKAQSESKASERAERYAEASKKASEYFSNNGGRMTVSYDGFKFYAPNWEKRNWGNTLKFRTTTTIRNGKTTETETITYTEDQTKEKDQ